MVLIIASLSFPELCPGFNAIIVVKNGFRTEAVFSELQEKYLLQARYPGLIHGLMPVRLHGVMSWETAVDIIESDHRVDYVEPDYLMYAAGMPDDPLFKYQWGLFNPENRRADIRSPEAWDVETGTKDVILAILDTGIDYLHPDLAGNIWVNPGEIPGNGIDDDGNGYIDDVHGWDFAYKDSDPMDVNSHGTNVAGAAGAVGNNGLGITGVIQKVSLMAVKGLGDYGYGNSSDLIAGIYYAVDNGAQVINASWGGGGRQRSMEAALEYAAAHNVIFVAACGNGGRDNDQRPFFPASYPNPNVVSVGATALTDSIALFSQYGKTSVDLFAPGVDIFTTTTGGKYMYNSGTSLAAPLLTGALGLLISAAPEADYRSYLKVMFESVRKLPQLRNYCVTGGRLDVEEMLNRRHKLFRSIEVSKIQRSILTVLSHIQNQKKGKPSP